MIRLSRAGYKDLCAFFIQNDQLQTAFALWIEYLYLLGLIIILLGDKHTTLHMSVVRARPLNMLSQKLFPQHFDTSEAEGLEREEIPYIGCGSCP